MPVTGDFMELLGAHQRMHRFNSNGNTSDGASRRRAGLLNDVTASGLGRIKTQTVLLESRISEIVAKRAGGARNIHREDAHKETILRSLCKSTHFYTA
jgi:hypothetical protein